MPTKINAKVIADSVMYPDENKSYPHRISTMMITFPRFILAELNTHRVFSKNSASCLVGDTLISICKPSDLKKGINTIHMNMKIKDIVDKWFDGDSDGRDMKSRIKSMHLRCLNEDTGEFTTTHITNCFRQGKQSIYELTLKNGYKLKCTDRHRIYTDDGWKSLSDIDIKYNNGITSYLNPTFKIATNGLEITKEWLENQRMSNKSLTDVCNEFNLNFKMMSTLSEKYNIFWRKFKLINETFEYKDINWLQARLNEGLFSTEIAKLCNTTSDRVKKSMKKFNLKGNKRTFKDNLTVWNKGLKYKQKEESLTKVREHANNRRISESYKVYRKYDSKCVRFLTEKRNELIQTNNYKCYLSGTTKSLHLHHIVPVWYDNSKEFDKNNIIPLNSKIHRFIHANNLDLKFMDYYNNGLPPEEFLNVYENVKFQCDEINKPKPPGNKLICRFYDIEEIKYIGVEETYDIEVSGKYRNFVANKIVVHNSRAIPFKKMLKSVISDPFIPLAFQKEHKGMQGTEYLDINKEYTWGEIQPIITEFLMNSFKDPVTGEWDEDYLEVDAVLSACIPFMYKNTLKEWWLTCRSFAVTSAVMLHSMGTTKQLCNRLLEPFMWHTVLLTSTEFENFFNLRCPKYEFEGKFYKSKKDAIVDIDQVLGENDWGDFNDYNQWAMLNEGQAEIHMMALAEAMWDALNESTPKELQAGEWHLPFSDDLDNDQLYNQFLKPYNFDWNPGRIEQIKLAIVTARCARTSYTVVGEEGKEHSWESDINVFEKFKIADPPHSSPFEHAARAMDASTEFWNFVRGNEMEGAPMDRCGWCNNFKGWIQYRYLIEHGE